MSPRTPLLASARDEISWAAVYVSLTLVAWVVAPFLRRLADWKAHFSAISPIAALPLVMLVPAVAMLFSGRARSINKWFELIALLWLTGFAYALVLAVLGGRIFGGVFSFVSFSLPLGFGLWISTRVEDAELWYRRVSQTAIVLAVIAGVYGVIQYTLLPPWDAAWMHGVDLVSAGPIAPFKVRVFSMLNSPATYAEFLTFATIVFLPRLTFKSAFLLLPIFFGLGLSLTRADWLALPLSIAVFSLLTTRRKQVVRGVSVFVCIGVLGVLLSQTAFSIGSGTVLLNRLTSLTDIAHDVSAASRTTQMADAWNRAIEDPEGSGLGVLGLATRLNNAQEDVIFLDSGYLSRFVEMGIPGILAFCASLAFALFAAIRVWRAAVRDGDSTTQNLAAMAIALQVAVLFLNVFADDSFGLAAIFAWTGLGLILRTPASKRSAQ